jgi:hypothetical protein
MTALVSAELLRVRTVRSPRYAALGALAFLALTAGLNVQPRTGGHAGAIELASSLRSLTLTAVLVAAVLAATNVATQFQGGTAALTYLSHPQRERVSAAQLLTYAGLGFAFAALAAAAVLIVGAAVAGADRFEASFSALDVARMVGGTAFGGAVMGAAGALAGALVRSPTVASPTPTGLFLAELTVVPASIHAYLPFGLADQLMGGTGDVPAAVAIGLLLAYLAAFAAAVHRWALPRDLT